MANLFILAGCAAVPRNPIAVARGDYEYVKAHISSLIKEEMKRKNVPGMSIALVDDQKIVWAQGFGYADVIHKIPASPGTVYPSGSIAKLFTIIAALRLMEQGKIDIDQPLQTYLPEFSIKTRFPGAHPITVRSLMTHHSGLPSDWFKKMMSRKPFPFTHLVNEIKDGYVAYPPNFIYSYSNVALCLLGHVVEKVSGQDFISYMDRSVLRPTGMTRTSFVPGGEIRLLLSKGYRGSIETEDMLVRDLPSPEGPLYTDVVDLSRFMQMVFADGMAGKQQVLKPETLSQMFQPQNGDVPLDLDFRIGLGWFLNDFDIKNAGLVASHGGSLQLFHSQLILLPEQKLGVVVLANSSTSTGIVSKIAEEALRLALEAKTGISQPMSEKPTVDPILSLPQAVLKDYEGYYATGLKVFKIDAKKGKLYTTLMGRTMRLAPHPDKLFSIQYRLFGFIPIKLEQLDGFRFSITHIAGHNVLVLDHKGKKQLLGERIRESPIPEEWLKRVGEYELLNSEDYYPMIEKASLKYEDDLLLLDVTMPMLRDLGAERLRLAIKPVSSTEAVILGLGRHMGETIQVVSSEDEERLRYSGCEFKKKSE